MDRFGRRNLILFGSVFMAVFMWLVGALTAAFPAKADQPTSPGQYTAVVFIFVVSQVISSDLSH
jgi:hypothetical protein